MVNLPLATTTFAVNHCVRDGSFGYLLYYTETDLGQNQARKHNLKQ